MAERPEVSKEEAVDALELLGGSFANDKDNYDIGRTGRTGRTVGALEWACRI